VQIGDNRAAEWVRRSNPVALGLLFSGLAGQLESYGEKIKKLPWVSTKILCKNPLNWWVQI
jgi:hypothetical protein